MITLEANGASNVAVLQCGEPFEQVAAGFEDYIKIAILGSNDLVQGGELDWQAKFINGLATVAGRQSGKAVNVYKNMNYLVFNCKTPPVSNGAMSVNNPEFMNTMTWINTATSMADAVFVNFLKNSTNPMPLYWFSSLSRGDRKMVVRVPGEDSYVYSGIINATCQMFNIPAFHGNMGNVLTILGSIMSFVPQVQTMNNPALSLPE